MAGRCRMSAILAGWLIGGSLVNVTFAAEYLLQGRVYEGVPWEQDKPIPGVTVELWGANDSGVPIQYIDSTATDAQGWYGLLLDTGDWAYDYYILWEKNPAGYVSTDARTVGGTRLSADQIQFGWPLEGVDFTGNKFWDKPEGQSPANHPPVADADGPYTGQVGQPITFDGSGSYDPDAGDSIVSYEWDLDSDGQYDDATGVTVQHTWTAAGSGTVGLRVTDTFGDAGVASSTYVIEEGPLASGTILGTKFNDLNGNGQRDAGEPGLAGWQITLQDDDGNVLATATTDGNGAYEFSSLEPGAYRVDEVQQSGWRQTYPEVDGQPAWWAVGVERGGTIDEVDFGNIEHDWPGTEYEEEHGDAPQPYFDFYLSVSETVFLGRHVDGEAVMQRDPHALGDDHHDGSDDEDGVEFVTTLVPGQQATVRIDLTGVTGTDFGVSGHIDFDRNGNWDATESIVSQPVTAGVVNTLTFTVPATAQPGPTFARFHIVDTGPVPPWGLPYGEVEDYEVTIGEDPGPLDGQWDFGDAPEGVVDGNNYNYQTTLANNGARHRIVPAGPCLRMNNLWPRPDAEPDGQPNIHASGDDISGDMDEHAAWSVGWPYQGRVSQVRVYVDGGGGYVDAWIDFNRDGTWQHPQERIVSRFLPDGHHVIDYTVPGAAVPGETFARVRINSNEPLPPYGPADDGEVVDDTTTIYEVDYGDAPDPPYPTLDASGGPWSGVPGYFLGTRVDGELDGQPDAHALGDDNDGTDDDDGVTFLTRLIPGQEATVKVVVELEAGNPNAEEICAWIDFNQNGDWENTELAIRQGPLKCTGKPEEYECKFMVPQDALLGTTYARFTVTYLTYSNPIPPDPPQGQVAGEIEDYEIVIGEDQAGSVTIVKRATPADDTRFNICAVFAPSAFFQVFCQSLQDPSNPQWAVSSPDLLERVREEVPAGWTLKNVTVTGDTDQGSVVDLAQGSVEVDYDPGEDIVIVFENVKSSGGGLDYGDAPASYGSAWHAIANGLSIGAVIDGEAAANTSAAADGDDTHQTDDEDGVTFSTGLAWGKPVEACVEIHNNDSNASNVTVAGWIDFDGNGQWAPVGEHIGSRAVHLPPFSIVKECWTFTVGQNANPGNTFARFRLYRDDPNPLAVPFAVLPTGDGGEGEVEDYRVYILSDAPGPDDLLDHGDAPAPYPDASHVLGGPHAGAIAPDGESSSQPDPPGPGDDASGIDDEDGLALLSDLVVGQLAGMGTAITPLGKDVTAALWIDFNRDGDWNDPGESFGPVGVAGGFFASQGWVFTVPASASPGTTYARLRVYEGLFSSVSPAGAAGPGEVEDVAVEIKSSGQVLPPGAIFGGVKFHDLNGNGQQDTGEPGLANWTIWIDLNGNGAKDAGEETLTNPDGSFYFMALAPGTYTIHEEMQSGWTQTHPGGSGVHTVTIQAGQPVPSVAFGNQRRDAAGGRDYGDARVPYPDASHELGGPWMGHVPPDAETVAQAHSQALGDDNQGIDDEDCLFHIWEMTPGGWAMIDIEYRTAGKVLTLFGWVDFNADGDWDDAGEWVYGLIDHTAVSGQQISGIGFPVPQNAVVGKTFARFRISEGVVPSLSPTGPGAKGEVEDFEVEIKADVPAWPPGGIVHGYKWNDLDGDGILDLGEPRLAGWTFWLDTNHTGVQDGGDMTTQTDATGHFRFAGVPAGTYTLGEQLQAGWTQTTPGGGGTYTVTVQSGKGTFPMMFGNRQSGGTTTDGKICGSKWHDLNGDSIPDLNEPWLAGWKIFLDSNQNGRWDAGEPSQLTDASGSFEFTGLAVGTYTVAEEMQSGWSQTWPGGASTHVIQIQPGVQPACVMFGNRQGDGPGPGPDQTRDWGDAPDPSYPTLRAANGAYHTIVPGFFLGGAVDGEPDGQPTPDALGDDHFATDDEDGVFFVTPLMPGQPAEVEVLASADGIVDAWIDFDADGSWAQTSDQILASEAIHAGGNVLSFSVPAGAEMDVDTFARFRFSTQGGLSPDGPAPDGEVEDYHVLLGPEGPGVAGEGEVPHVKWSQPPIEIDPNVELQPVFCGWNEAARSTESPDGRRQWRIDADDFRCLGPIPITRIRWWGGYEAWEWDEPPELQPEAWHIGFWANQVEGLAPDELYLERLVWSVEVPNERVRHEPVGLDEFPGGFADMCFVYELQLEPQEWFHQVEFPSNEGVFWISITAIYPPDVEQVNMWGWQTRPHVWRDGAQNPAIRGEWPTPEERLFPGRIYPIESDVLCGRLQPYDLCFELLTENPWVKWDLPFGGIRQWPGYVDLPSQGVSIRDDENFSSLITDDWVCERCDPVVAVAWWGSYIGSGYEPCACEQNLPLPRPDYFLLSIRADAPATDEVPYGSPGEVVWQYRAYEYDEVLVGYDRHPEGEPNEPVFRYCVRLPDDNWFRQEAAGGLYWFSVAAVYTDPLPQIAYPWGWTNHRHTFGSPALVADGDSLAWRELLDEESWPVDMSFTLFTAPQLQPVAHWPFDETEGNIAFDSAGEHHGTVHGATWTEGWIEGALQFNGFNNYVDCQAGDDLGPEHMTLMMWLRPEHMGGTRSVLSRGRSETDMDYGLKRRLEGEIEFFVVPEEDGPVSVVSQETTPLGQWSHVAVTCDGEQLAVCINGRLRGTAACAPRPLRPGCWFVIGSLLGQTRFYHGKIDEVQLYSVLLPPEHIAELAGVEIAGE